MFVQSYNVVCMFAVVILQEKANRRKKFVYYILVLIGNKIAILYFSFPIRRFRSWNLIKYFNDKPLLLHTHLSTRTK